MNQRPLPRIGLALWALLALLVLASAAQAQEASDVGRLTVAGEGDKPSAGAVADEEMTKGGSAATRAQFDKLRASVNPFQGMTVLPGANSNSWDAIDLFNQKLQLTPAMSVRRVNRDATPFASPAANTAYPAPVLNGGMAGAPGSSNKDHLGVVSSLTGSMQVAPDVQVFSSLSKSLKAPGHYDDFSLVNGAGSAPALYPLRTRQESALALDMGALYKSSLFKASATAFLVKFKDRITASFEPSTGTAQHLRVGNSMARGLEVEAGTLPVLGFSAYASATYILGYTEDGTPAPGNALAAFGDAGSVAAQFPGSGLLFPGTPKGRAALSLQYMKAPLLVNLAGKYTGRRNITVVGEQSLAGFTTFDVNLALQLPPDRFFKSPTLRLDVGNVTNKRWLPTNLPSLYGGAPRFTSITLQSDF